MSAPVEEIPFEGQSSHSRSSNDSSSNRDGVSEGRKDVHSIINVIDNTYHAGLFQITLLGLGISLGGSLIGWNAGLVEGFWVYFTSYVIVGIGYLCLVLCLAELTSIMAFAGGAYGYIRCSVSPFLGYLLGCCEWLQNNMFVISCVSSMGFAITEATRQPLAFEILDYFIIYLFLLMFHIRGGRYFWMAMSTCAILTTAVILLYILAAFTADPNFFHTNITTDERYRFKTDNGGHIFHELYLPCWFFIGCETLTIAGAKIANGTDVIPTALLGNFVILTVLATFVLFTTVVQYYDATRWSDVYLTNFPISHGLRHSLGISERISSVMTLLPSFSSALGFLYASKHLTQAMSLSGLFSPFFKKVFGPGQVPLRALLSVSAMQVAILVIGWAGYDTHDHDHPPPYFELCMLGASFSYIGIFAAYCVFAREYAGMERKFVSPLGVYGAYAGIVVFVLVIISIIGFHPKNSTIVGVFFGYLGFVALYYYLVAETRQGFSIEEQKRFMRAYILNSNQRRRKKKSHWERLQEDVHNWLHFMKHGHFRPEKVHTHNPSQLHIQQYHHARYTASQSSGSHSSQSGIISAFTNTSPSKYAISEEDFEHAESTNNSHSHSHQPQPQQHASKTIRSSASNDSTTVQTSTTASSNDSSTIVNLSTTTERLYPSSVPPSTTVPHNSNASNASNGNLSNNDSQRVSVRRVMIITSNSSSALNVPDHPATVLDASLPPSAQSPSLDTIEDEIVELRHTRRHEASATVMYPSSVVVPITDDGFHLQRMEQGYADSP